MFRNTNFTLSLEKPIRFTSNISKEINVYDLRNMDSKSKEWERILGNISLNFGELDSVKLGERNYFRVSNIFH